VSGEVADAAQRVRQRPDPRKAGIQLIDHKPDLIASE
jgi:hypothetical protein